MHKALRLLVPLAAAAAPVALTPGVAVADSGSSYQATLNPLNHQTGSGMAMITLNGNTATIDVSWSGLATTFKGGAFPHVQHIHIDGQGRCPTASDDKNGDGVVSTPEGISDYGAVGTTLSEKGDTSAKAATDVTIAPSGGSTTYHRTFTLNADTASSLRNGTGVVVVHGLDPSTISKKAQGESSPLVKSLPLAATAPALCGALTAMPAGGVATGTGSTAGVENPALFGVGGGLLALGAAGMATYAVRRRRYAPTA